MIRSKNNSATTILLLLSSSLCLILLSSIYCHAFAINNNNNNIININRWGPIIRQSSSSSSSSLLKAATVSSSTDDTEKTQTQDESNNNNNNVKTSDVLSLESIRSTLIRQEETIIFALIERSQFRCNNIVYKKGGFGNLGIPAGSTEPEPSEPTEEKDEDNEDELLSFLEYMLIGTEAIHAVCRRYTSPEEHSFFPKRLPKSPLSNLPKLDYPSLLSNINNANNVNYNTVLLKKYIKDIVPSISFCFGDDEQHGGTVLADIAILQALSRRIHYGKFVAESKYQKNPTEYQKLVDNDDADGVMALLTNEAVEKKVLQRARLKAATYGREPLILPDIIYGDEDGQDENKNSGRSNDSTTTIVAAAAASAVVAAVDAMKTTTSTSSSSSSTSSSSSSEGKVDPYVIETIYRDIIIPLTKDIEVAYLFKRCGKEPPKQYTPEYSLSLLLDEENENEETDKETNTNKEDL